MEKLKDIMKTKGICLLEFGVNSRAFNREEIQDILEILREEGIAVKGGDVWKKNDNNIILTYDNWYCERNQNETYSDFVNRSIEYTNIYINNYNIGKGDLYFELVI
jgi:hypothetical protein